jgi:hypothetical protein
MQAGSGGKVEAMQIRISDMPPPGAVDKSRSKFSRDGPPPLSPAKKPFGRLKTNGHQHDKLYPQFIAALKTILSS